MSEALDLPSSIIYRFTPTQEEQGNPSAFGLRVLREEHMKAEWERITRIRWELTLMGQSFAHVHLLEDCELLDGSQFFEVRAGGFKPTHHKSLDKAQAAATDAVLAYLREAIAAVEELVSKKKIGSREETYVRSLRLTQ